MAPVTRRTRRARLGTVGVFFLSGLALAVWVVNIPAVQHRVGVSNGVLGALILLLGLGAFLGMQAAGPIVDRIGSRWAALIAAGLLIVGVNLPGLATGPWQLGAALLVLGAGTGSIDVAMNDQAVRVQRLYGRPIMANFHAFFSVGGGVGALLGAGIQALGLSVNWCLGIGALITAVLTLVSVPALLAGATATGADASIDTRAVAPAPLPRRRRTTTIVVLACLAFLMMLSEGTANDWSALQAVQRLDASRSVASLAYGAFSIAMTVGRFATDAVNARLGAVRVVRLGAVVAAAGMVCVVLSPVFPLTLAGWIVFGLGLSGIIPQVFTAAGNLGGAGQGVVISRVVGAGYLGLLAGPAIIGWVSQGIGLTAALILPVACCITGALLAGSVSPLTRRDATDPTPTTIGSSGETRP